MKTPFDGAIRLRRREIDALRISIRAEVERLVVAEAAHADANAALRAERGLAAQDPLLTSHAYLARMQAGRVRAARDLADADARLQQLRALAMEAYGSVRALENAGAAYRDDAQRLIERAEQDEIDDRAAAAGQRATPGKRTA